MKPWITLSFVTCALGLCGCKKPAAAGGAAAGGFAVQAVIVEARLQPVSETLSLVATLAANEMVEIKSETDGVVEKILFEEGARVKAGEQLMQLDESKFGAAVAVAEANLKLSRVTYERSQQLHREKLISQQEYDQAAAIFQSNEASLDLKKRERRDTQIAAPFAGLVGGRTVSPGQVISRNTTLTWIVDLEIVKVEVSVPERFLGQLNVGQSLELAVAAFPGEKFKGAVYFIAPQIDPLTRTAFVKAKIANAGHKLKPGMFASLDLTLKLKEAAVVIPESAIIASGDRTIVYVVGPDDTAQMRPVKLGMRLSGIVEVLTGLKERERVVAEGIQKVRPGGKVRAPSPASPSPSATADKKSLTNGVAR